MEAISFPRPHILYGVVAVEILPGDFVSFRARRDRRLFRVTSLDGDAAVLRCPCCGVTGSALIRELRWLHPLEAGVWLDGGADTGITLADARRRRGNRRKRGKWN